MIEPADREPVEPAERKRLTVGERAAILARQVDHCPKRGETLIWAVVDAKPIFGPMIDEHIIPLQLGGSNALSNRELWCVPCAKVKTKRDLKAIAKVQRIRRRQAGQERPKQKIRSRGFPRDPMHWKNA